MKAFIRPNKCLLAYKCIQAAKAAQHITLFLAPPRVSKGSSVMTNSTQSGTLPLLLIDSGDPAPLEPAHGPGRISESAGTLERFSEAKMIFIGI